MKPVHLGVAIVLLVAVVLGAVVALGWLARRAGWPRRTLWTGGVIAALLVGGQALVVDGVLGRLGGGPGGPGGLGGLGDADLPVLDWVVGHRDPVITGFAIVAASIGGTASMTVLTVVTALVLGYLGRWTAAAVVAATAAGGGLLVISLKAIYGRHRPPAVDQVIHYHGYSLPSGHALGSTVVVGIVAAAFWSTRSSAAGRAAVAGLAGLIAAVVGVSRVYLAAHWLTDVVTGWLLGAAWLALGITALALVRATSPAEGATPRHDPLPR
ncbi:MAG TPA: phosphatase PAP2 family protein [Pseudonocardia sp.]